MLPIEIVFHILSFFDANEDQETLRDCTLVESGWRRAAQEILFRHFTIKFNNSPRHEDYEELTDQATRAYRTLIECIDQNPLLQTYIHHLSLQHFEVYGFRSQSVLPKEEAEKDAISRLLMRFTNVKSLKLFRFETTDGLQEALLHLCRLPSLIRFEASYGQYPSVAALLTSLISARNLQFVVLTDIGFQTSRSLSKEESLDIAEAGSIKLKTMKLARITTVEHLALFFGEPFCPFSFSRLTILRLGRPARFDYDTVARLLSLVGKNLEYLEIHAPDQTREDKENLHLGHTPNLRSLVLTNLRVDSRETVTQNSILWIQSLFPLSVTEDERHPVISSLRMVRLEVIVNIANSTSKSLGASLWTPWTAIDALFSSNASNFITFSSLETVAMTVSTPAEPLPSQLQKLVKDQFPELEQSGKFQLETTYWEMAATTALMRMPAIAF